MAKIQKLKDTVGQRWGGDGAVRTSCVHKDGNDICCEIDGGSKASMCRCTARSSPSATVLEQAALLSGEWTTL